MRILFLLLLCIDIPFFCTAQCCSPGNPLGGYGNNGTLGSNSLKLYSQYKYSYSGKYMAGDQLYGGDTKDFRRSVRDANFSFVGLGMAWGISESITIEAESGYFINKTQRHVAGVLPESQKGIGFTDLSFLLKTALYKKNEWEFTPTFGLKFPLGRYNQKYKGSVLPPDLQPTTGAVNFVTGFFLYKGFLKQHLRFFIISRYEFPRTNPLEIKYGNVYIHSFFSSLSIGRRVTTIVQIRHEQRERDKASYAATGYYSSGSSKLLIIPQLSYDLTTDWNMSVFCDVPIYQYYNGYQLGNSIAASVMVSKNIDTGKKEFSPPK